MFESHYHEKIPQEIKDIFESGKRNAKQALEAMLLERNVTFDGERILPTSYLPRILPANYETVVEKACRLLTEAMLETAYTCPQELDIPGLNRSFIKQTNVLKNMPKKAVGTYRFDFAVCGKPSENNPPKLLEANCVDYGGAGWVPDTMQSVIETLPQLQKAVSYRDIREGMARHFKKMGESMLFITAGETGYPDYALFERAIRQHGIRVGSISDDDFREAHIDGKISMNSMGIEVRSGSAKGHYDFIYPRCFTTRGEMAYMKEAVNEIIDAQVPLYDNLFGMLLENKSMHRAFARQAKKMFSPGDFRFLGNVFVSSAPLDDKIKKELEKRQDGKVLKSCDGHMGKRVFAESAMLPILKSIKRTLGWVVQDFVKINTAELEPLGSQAFRGIVDLSVYVGYVFDSTMQKSRRMQEFSVSGYLCRSSGSSYKVNVSSGGCFVPVFFQK